eukprot:gene8832-15315_t
MKEGAVPSIFDWAAEPKTRRKIVRHTERLTDPEDLAEEQKHDTEDDAMKMELLEEELRSLQIELDETKNALFRTKSELEASKRLAKEEMEKVCREMADLQRSTMEQLKVSRFGLERFSTDSASIKFYTGFPTYSHLKIFFELARRGAEFMKYCYASGERGSRPASRQLQQIDELFLFLVRLKLGLFEQDLADRFQMNISSISRKLTTWANYL